MFLKRLKILMDELCQGKQSILAQKANLPKSIISSYFSRGSQPSLSQLIALSNALGCSIDYLAGLEPDLEDDIGNIIVQSNNVPDLWRVKKKIDIDFKTRLKELRSEKNLTQKELAAYLGLTANCICEWEKGRSEPGIESLQKLVACFGCSIDYLIGIEDDFGNIVVQNNSTIPLLSAEEKELIENYRSLNLTNKIRISEYTRIRLEEQGTKNERKF